MRPTCQAIVNGGREPSDAFRPLFGPMSDLLRSEAAKKQEQQAGQQEQGDAGLGRLCNKSALFVPLLKTLVHVT